MADSHPDAFRRPTILTLFGTRPEIIKLAPVIREIENRADRLRSVVVSSGQHTDLLTPFIRLTGVRVDHDLRTMRPGQPLSTLLGAVLREIDPILVDERPDAVLVQGDTTTALGGALAAFHRGIAVGHVEAGLRTDDPSQPFPEEMNRRLITRIAQFHFAATPRNCRTLLAEGISGDAVYHTGNPVVDALQQMEAVLDPSDRLRELLRRTQGLRRIALTTHRRESFGETMGGNLRVLREFVEDHADTAVIFPVHPNPHVTQAAADILGGCDRIHLTDPLDYQDFIGLLSACWIIVSDSGGVQEEAPSLGKPLIVLREKTERPEAVESGVARLAGEPVSLATALAEVNAGVWAPTAVDNPFGRGDAGRQIVDILERRFVVRTETIPAATPLTVSAADRPVEVIS